MKCSGFSSLGGRGVSLDELVFMEGDISEGLGGGFPVYRGFPPSSNKC